MSAEYTWTGYDALDRKLARLQDPDASPLMERWERIIADDNRAGILAGTDKDGVRMAKLAPATLKGRKGTGPPLAPRGPASRVISRLVTAHGHADGRWFALAAWDGVTNSRGDDFLKYHFSDAPRLSNLPRRDLRGLRPAGRNLAREAYRQWLQDLLRT